AYPGNPQGRNPRESGPRGCFQVDVDRSGQAHLEFIETNLVRWVHLEVSIQAHARLDNLLDAILEKGREATSAFAGPTIARCTLRGNGPLHHDLQRDGLAEELREELHSVLPTESVRIATGPALDLRAIASTETLISDFLRLADKAMEEPELRQRLMD